MSEHEFNDPGLDPREFLFAVMHDPAVDISSRIRAAEHLCRLGLGNQSGIPVQRIEILGGMPDRYRDVPPEWLQDVPGCPRFVDFSPELQRDLLYVKWCADHGFNDPNSPAARALFEHTQDVPHASNTDAR
jgi:hypothetical protein